MLILSLLFACGGSVADLGPVEATVPRSLDAALGVATEPVIVRPECFGVPSWEEARLPPPAPSAPTGRANGGSSSGTVTLDSTSSASKRPRQRGPRKAKAAETESAPFYSFDEEEADYDDASSIAFGRDEPLDMGVADAGAVYAPAPEPEPLPPAEPKPAPQASMDWGGSTYLSNDDSMSLASAQRVLWAVANGRQPPIDEIRPHELLNYFSFDTEPVRSGRMFSVLGSAARTDESTLSVAMAVQGATPPHKALDLTVVVDRSGSMSAAGRMEYTKRGLGLMADQLQDGDRVDIVLFDDEVCTAIENYVEGRDDPSLLTDTISRIQPRGATDLDRGLREGYRIATPRAKHGIRRNRRVMVLTDAFLNTGDVDPNTVSQIGAAYEEHGVRLTGVGVGRDFNDRVLNMLTEKGKGAYVYLGSEAVVDRLFGSGFESLTRTIAHDVHFELDLPPSLALERFYGEEASTNKADVQPIHYYAGTSQVFLQDLSVDPSKLDPKDPVVLKITYREAATGEPATQTWRTTVGALVEGSPHNLDKSRALMAWTDLLMADAMGADPCGEPRRTWTERAALLPGDAEIAYVDTLVRSRCGAGTPVPPPPPAQRVALKVVVDSDVVIPEAALWCQGVAETQSLGASDKVARFQAVPGTCDLVLQGVVPMRTAVQVPTVASDMRCVVRGGRLACN